MVPLGIEPTTFRLVAQCLDQQCLRVCRACSELLYRMLLKSYGGSKNVVLFLSADFTVRSYRIACTSITQISELGIDILSL